MQRTRGGMNMFDLHVLPRNGDCITIDNISHDCMPRVRELGELCIDAGSDPIRPRRNDAGEWDIQSIREYEEQAMETDSSDDDGSVYEPGCTSAEESSDVEFESDISSDSEWMLQ